MNTKGMSPKVMNPKFGKSNTMYSKLKKTILASAFLAASVMAQTPYDEGQKSLREQNWTGAAEQFQQSIKANKGNADAAMYWRAHALYQAGRKAEAERQISNLESKYPDSRWIKQAQVLQIENQNAASVAQSAASDSGLDEDLRMFALSRLMERDPKRATPLVLEALRNTTSEENRNDALFVLGMSDEPEAQRAITELARDSSNPGLQANAIYMLGAASTDTSMALLQSLYTTSAPKEVKESIIQAHLAADEPGFLVTMLSSEQDPQLRNDIIHALGAMDATAELAAIYPTLANRESKIAALEAFSMSDDIDMLKQALATETDPELRRTAIHGLAMSDSDDSAAFLETLYFKASSKQEKADILESLVMMDYSETLALTIVRAETDPELQKEAIHVLGIIDATDKLAGLYANLNSRDAKEAVLEALGIADDSSSLINILKVEQDQELRNTAIQALGINGDQQSADYLIGAFPKASRQDKTAIIESLMIMDDAEGLIGLIKVESDPEMKRDMLEMLTAMDAEASDEYLFKLLEEK